jgi:hypothetical protein
LSGGAESKNEINVDDMTTDRPKKKQHFVAQLYLRRWHDDRKRVATWVDDKIAPRRTEDVGHARYFYEVFGINESECELLLQGLKRVKTPDVDIRFRSIIKNCREIGVSEESGINAADSAIEVYKKNVIEDYYGITEDIVAEAYQKAVDGNFRDFSHVDYQNLLRFATYQLGRTPKAREKIRLAVEPKLTLRGIRFDRWYTLSMLMTAEELFLALIEQLYKFAFIENKTSQPFITSDNPVFNLKGVEDPAPELFWPLTPFLAVLISRATTSKIQANAIRQDWLKKRTLSSYYLSLSEEHSLPEIHRLNKLSWDNKHRFAFALREQDLLAFCSG